MRVRDLLAETVAPFVDFVYPPRCPACGDAIAQQSGLCVNCWSMLEPPQEPLCLLCYYPISEDGAVCSKCARQKPMHDGIIAATRYNKTSRTLILAFKHGGQIALARMLARLIASRLPAPDNSAILVPVPLHRWRLLARGYNQSALLAKELAKMGYGALLLDGLIRRKATPSLGGSNAAERHELLRNAILVNDRRTAKIEGAKVLLVDDVLTSGATTSACVAALKRAGAASVTIACVARVIDQNAKTPEVLNPGR